MDKILRVDMTNMTAKFEDVPEKYKLLGGRGLTSTIVADEVPPTCDPLGAFNKIVCAPGLVTGTSAPTSGRLSVGGKSPLTGGIKEANAGGVSGQKLARLGIKAIIVEGEAKDGQFHLLKVSKDKASFEPAGDLVGIGLFDFAPKFAARFGEKAGFIACGVAGEMKMANAGVCVNDMHNVPSRYAGRGGLGAVMGAKGLKAIVLDDSQGAAPVPKNPEAFKEAVKKFTEGLRAHPVTSQTLPQYGTNALQNVINEAGALPTKNFKSGRFEGASKVSGEALHEMVDKIGGEGYYAKPCMPGCAIQCSNNYPASDGSSLSGGPIEYESAWSLGSDCMIDDMAVVARLNWLCNDIGLDSIEAGNTIAIAMEGGVVPFGDGPGAIGLLEEVKKGTPLGRIIGQGGAFTGKAFGVTRIPATRGQCMPAYEPRAIKGIGVTYATTPMGADHTAGYSVASEILGVGGKTDPLTNEGKIALSRAAQIGTAFVDSTGYCLFVTFATTDLPDCAAGMVGTVSAMYGVNWTNDDVVAFGTKVLKTERDFNEAAGVGAHMDVLPEFMYTEKLPPHNVVYEMGNDELRKVFADLG